MKMAINPKEHYNKLESINTTKLNLGNTKLVDIVNKKKLDLLDDLTQDFLFIEDANTIDELGHIKNKLKNTTDVGSVLRQIEEDLKNVNVKITTGDKKNPKWGDWNDEQTRLTKLKTMIGAERAARHDEYKEMEEHAEYFRTNIKKKNIDLTTTGPIQLGTTTRSTEDLKNKFVVGGPAASLSFELYNTSIDKLKKNGANYIVSLSNKTGGTQEIEIDGMKINSATSTVDFTNIKLLDPITKADIKDEIDLSKDIEIVIVADYDRGTNVHVANQKTLKFKLEDPTNKPLDITGRETALDNYDQFTPGHVDVIKNSINEKHLNNIAEIEREAFFRALRSADGPKLNLLTPEQQDDLYQTVRNQYIGMAEYTDPYKDMPGAPAGTHPNTGLATMNDYGDFKMWFTTDKHPGSKKPNNSSEKEYMNYINNNIETQINEYYKQRFDEVFEKDLIFNRYLKTNVTDYLRTLQERRLDNDVHQVIEETDINNLPERRKIKRTGEILSRRLHENNMENPRSILRPRDVNYMRFFSKSSVSINDQVVDVNTNTHPDDLKNPQPVKYGMSMNVSGKNNIVLDVDLEGQEKARKRSGEQLKEHIRIGSGEPVTLIRKILRNPAISHGKTRAHIAYNVIKGMIQMAQNKNISLNYVDNNNEMRLIKLEKNGNIVLDRQDDWSNRKGNTRRIPHVIFDYQDFTNRKDFDKKGDTGSIRTGIDNLLGHFNLGMNRLHKDYRIATERKLLGTVESEMKTRLSHSVWSSPLKKLLNFRTVTKFDFSTSLQTKDGKTISISSQKNVFTVSMPGLKKPIKSSDFGKILNHREGRVRTFDGVEREMIEAIYTKIIAQMRLNTKIARSNFGVSDPITRRIYIMNKDGHFGYITAEERNVNGNPISRGGIMKNKNYGVIHKIPPAMTIHYYNEDETKEILKNPFIIGRFAKAMNSRMNLFENVKSIFH